MDETQTSQAENPTVAEDSNVATQPVAEPTTSVADPVTEEDDDDELPSLAEQDDAAERKSEPRPAERKIRSQHAEIKQLREELAQRNQELDSLSRSQPLPPQTPDVNQFLQGKDSIDPQELNEYVRQQTAQAGQTANLEVAKLRDELARKDAMTQYDRDQVAVEKELSSLPPEVASAVEKQITAAFKAQAMVKNPYNPKVIMINPSVRLSDIARGYIDIAKASAETGKSQAAASISDAYDHQALTPTESSTKTTKAFDDMSPAEMREWLKSHGSKIK